MFINEKGSIQIPFILDSKLQYYTTFDYFLSVQHDGYFFVFGYPTCGVLTMVEKSTGAVAVRFPDRRSKNHITLYQMFLQRLKDSGKTVEQLVDIFNTTNNLKISLCVTSLLI